MPSPTFDYFTATAQNIGLTKITVPLTADKKIDLQAVLSAITPTTSLIYMCNPNNPTGTICQRDKLVQFVKEIYTRIHQSRKYTIEKMEKMGIPCIPSYTNFINRME